MSSLSRNLKWFAVLIAAVGAALLAWALLDQWHGITERHEIRQRSQVATLAGATQAVMESQEMVLDLLGRQLLIDGLIEDPPAARVLLDRMLEVNRTAAVYGLADVDGQPLVFNSGIDPGRMPNLLRQEVSRDTFIAALKSRYMVIGRPYRIGELDAWVIPVRKAIRGADGELLGVMTAGLQLDGPEPFFEEQSFLGPRNTVQIVRDDDLYPLHWAARTPPPDDYYRHAIPHPYYVAAISSAERRSGLDIVQIKASGRPYSYRNVNAQGPQFGMAVYDPRYGYWVLSQTHRGQLLREFARVAWIYAAVFVVILLGVLQILRTIGRSERGRQLELIYQANHDALTTLPNRQRMTQDFEYMRGLHGERFSLLFVDMDNFKAVNDGFGHVQGDALLQQLGRRLQRFASDQERVARIGGDEFVLLTPETDREALLDRARALIDQLARHYMVNDMRCELGCSVGIARVAEAGSSLSDVLRAADVAMYAAKNERNSARFFEPSMGRNYLENIRIEQKLRAAVEQGEVYMTYQPQVDRDGVVVGVEALARWDDEDLGGVDPRRFIAIAEASGFIKQVGDYILRTVLDDARALQEHLDREMRLSINISIRQFMQPEFSARMIEQVAEADLDRIRPVIEITESLFMEDHGLIMEELERLRIAGVRVSLDDFGTGFSSLALLRTLPVDELKIDKSFIDHLESDDNARKLIQSVVAIGKSHGMSLVAEGVETERQFELLCADGCDTFQGFLFARPMPLLDFIAWLSERG
ncbi:MAG: putative bifunctional diguanylate cyclase/phosphodiesterase [Candidatus Wenzhouxiangella sp. M2_3B_020]